MNRFRNISLILLVVLLLIASVYNVVMYLHATGSVEHAELLDNVPITYAGYQVVERKVAETERVQRAVDEQLNYDGAVFREFRSGSRVLQVYAARWRPGKMHPRLISIHVPDVCWVVNGWTMSDPDYNYRVSADGVKMHHAQYRLFEASGTRMHVLYWHVLDGRLSGYAEGPGSKSRGFFGNLLDGVGHAAGEQYFIRLSSPQPWAEWVNEPLFKDVVTAFSPILADRDF